MSSSSTTSDIVIPVRSRSRPVRLCDVITLTDSAASKVKELLEAEGEPELALRVAVRPGGCSGYSYEMFFDGDIAGDDQQSDFAGVKVIVDPSSAQLLTGATLDY